MPTKPIIPHNINNTEISSTLNHFADLIEESVNFGTHVLSWHAKSATGGDDILPITMSLRHSLELLDSISINIRKSCVNPCKLLLRGVLESFFCIAYILEGESTQRAMAFMTTYINQNLKTCHKLQPTSEQGIQFRQLIKKDRLASNMDISIPVSLIDLEISKLEGLLSKPKYKDANAHYLKLRKSRTTNPHWYSFYGGPKNLEQLAEHLNLSAIYDILYRQWSGVAHGTDIIQGNISATTSDHIAIKQIRLSTDAQVLTFFAVSFALELFRTIIEFSVPDKIYDYRNWYSNEIRPTYMHLIGDTIINVDSSRSNGK